MNRWLATLAVAGALVSTSAPAWACKGTKTLFSDDFQQVDSSWGLDAPDVMVEDGKVKVKPQPNISNLLVYKGLVFGDADLCLTVRMPNVVSNDDNTMAGPIFWQKDYDNYYMFMITPSGFAEIARKLDGKWVTVIDWRADSNIKLPAGSSNVLRVVTDGNTIATYINDAKFATVKGSDAGGRRPCWNAGAIRAEAGRHLEVQWVEDHRRGQRRRGRTGRYRDQDHADGPRGADNAGPRRRSEIASPPAACPRCNSAVGRRGHDSPVTEQP